MHDKDAVKGGERQLEFEGLLNTWHHVAIQYDGLVLNTFLDAKVNELSRKQIPSNFVRL